MHKAAHVICYCPISREHFGILLFEIRSMATEGKANFKSLSKILDFFIFWYFAFICRRNFQNTHHTTSLSLLCGWWRGCDLWLFWKFRQLMNNKSTNFKNINLKMESIRFWISHIKFFEYCECHWTIWNYQQTKIQFKGKANYLIFVWLLSKNPFPV